MPKAAKKRITTTKKGTARNPIFPRIEMHRKLDRAYLRLAALEEAGLDCVTEADLERASDALERAAWKMARTKPTTVAGASAMLTYITTGNTTGLFTLGEQQWHEAAFRNAAAALVEISRSKLAA
jgi:hypothetical protein